MNSAEVLTEAFTRIRGVVAASLDGLTADDLAARPNGEGNSIAWLIWHLTRIQDDHVAEVAGRPQIWLSRGWQERFGLPLEPADHGYGHTSEQVSAVRASADLLLGYHDAVYQRTLDYLQNLLDVDLDRVVDTSWDPPVTLGVRLISVISDDLQHAGQAAYAAGLLKVS
jgi:DinB family protein